MTNNYRDWYTAFPPEGLVVNVLGATLMGLAILMPVLMLIRYQQRGPSALAIHRSLKIRKEFSLSVRAVGEGTDGEINCPLILDWSLLLMETIIM
ncbi:hypothetical protein OUZ56_024877 [Daphnia magna]|uniref:Uncharacterized protein n=1 Tax=Daphnia magna TaxID=35525 RepID=A0ABQ9ZJP2_9CRUS|nr:hypothetical protein OUZ56_024877 [Daphnia magna]